VDILPPIFYTKTLPLAAIAAEKQGYSESSSADAMTLKEMTENAAELAREKPWLLKLHQESSCPICQSNELNVANIGDGWCIVRGVFKRRLFGRFRIAL